MEMHMMHGGIDGHSRLSVIRAELIERIARALPSDGGIEPLPGVHLMRASSPTAPLHSLTGQAFCVIAQGSKQVLLGDDSYRYDPAHYLITTAELPVASRILEAADEMPYLSLSLRLDPVIVSSVMVETGHLAPASHSSIRALDVSRVDVDLMDAALRLVRLAERREEGRYLGPLIVREIIYRLLVGSQGGRLRQLAILNGSRHRIADAIDRLRDEYDRPLRVEEMARDFGMSASSFHHHFKAVTSLSPLQFQKHLRMQEARRLMLGEGYDAASAGYQVGYDDPSYFSREYKKIFGEPPRRDIDRLRGNDLEPASV